MKYDTRHRLHRATDQEGARPALQHVWLERIGPEEALLSAASRSGEPWNAVAVAADGFCLAVVPVLLDETECDGPLLAVMWQKGKGSVFVHADRVALSGASLSRALPGVLAEAATMVPPWRRIAEKLGPLGRPRRSTSRAVVFNVSLLARLAEAIGTHPSNALDWHRTMLTFGRTPAHPILVESGPPDRAGRLVPPFGVLMPMLGGMRPRETEAEHAVE